MIQVVKLTHIYECLPEYYMNTSAAHLCSCTTQRYKTFFITYLIIYCFLLYLLTSNMRGDSTKIKNTTGKNSNKVCFNI